MTWGFLAGTLGAFGAFSLTSAMLSGGKPLFVMPIVFGGAVTVTAIVSAIELKDITKTSPLLWIGMVAVVIGVVLVAANTPHGRPPAKQVEQKNATDTSAHESPADTGT